MTTHRVSVLVVSWNTRELTLACLDALPAAAAGLPFETIVVDNASGDGSREALAARSDIRFVANEANEGFARGVNLAYARSAGDLVLLLNSDVLLEAGQLAELVAFLDTLPPRAAGVAPVYRNSDGTHQAFHFNLPTYAQTLATGSSLARRLPALARARAEHAIDTEPIREARVVPQPSASCLLLRRACLPAGHVLDERYPIFFNDVELARFVAASGHELWVTPDVTVTHVAHSSTRQGGVLLRRPYIAGAVQMLQETEPRHRVLLYQALMLVQGTVARALRRPGATSLRELAAALRGDPGSLPTAPSAKP